MSLQVFPLPSRGISADADSPFPSDPAREAGEGALTRDLFPRPDLQEPLEPFGPGMVSPAPGVAAELVAATHPDSHVVEQLRSVRTQLMLRWFETSAGQGALAVLSPGRGEGRSWVAANLAVLFSQLGKRTVLVDADLRHPRQHRIFGVQERLGLSAVLAGGGASWEVVTEPTAVRGLSLLPAGPVVRNPQELLGRPAFLRLMAALRAHYEVILVDTPATESFADAATIAARAGAALLVACRDRSSMPRLARLSDDLRQFRIPVVGSILNGVPEHGRPA